MKQLKWVIIIFICGLLSLNISFYVGGDSTFDVDTTISTPTVWQDETINMNGNLTISDSLSMDNVDLIMGKNDTWIKALSGSTLLINNSRIYTSGDDVRYSFFVEENVVFSFENTTMTHFGTKDPERLRSASVGTPEYEEYNRYFYILEHATNNLAISGDDGFEIKSTALKFNDNHFDNYTHIRVFSENNIIENCTFENMTAEGLAFMNDADNSVIKYNIFKNAVRMNRETFGLRFYPDTHHQLIHHNHFSWLPSACMMGNVPPWWGGEYFEFHHNVYRKVLMGVDGNIWNSHFHHEDFSNIYSRCITPAGRYITIDNCSMTNLDFQGEVDHIVTMDHFWEAWNRDGHCGIPNIAYWMFGFYCTKYLVRLAGTLTYSTIKDNYFANTPPYSFAIDMDANRKLHLDIVNNTFENIETYIPDDYTIRQDYTGHVQLADADPLTGATIILENADHINIRDNIFDNVLHGVATTGPDGLGNAGNFTIENNFFRGVQELKFNEDRKSGNYWVGNHSMNVDGVGIGTGLDWWSTDGIKVQPEYYGDSVQTIRNNTLYNFKRPVIVDYNRRFEAGASGDMGVKHCDVYDNAILNYGYITTQLDSPNTITMGPNILRQECPGSFQVHSIDGHTVTAYVDNYIVPTKMVFPNFYNWTVMQWDGLEYDDGTLDITYSTDDGVSWNDVPSNKSLLGINSSSKMIRLNVSIDQDLPLDPALLTEHNITLTFLFNNPPEIELGSVITGEKNEPSFMEVSVTDPDLDEVAYQWEYLQGPVTVDILNDTTKNASFIPYKSGVYRFRVNANDGFATVNDTISVVVGNDLPSCDVDSPASVFKFEKVVLLGFGSDPDKDTLEYIWNQTSGPSVELESSNGTASFVPSETGTYVFELFVNDGEANSTKVEASVVVYSRPPNANLSASILSAEVNDPIWFSANGSVDPDGNLSQYYFNFGDGSPGVWVDSPWAGHIFDTPGVYSVSLKVMDDDLNISETVSIDVNITPEKLPPIADFTMSPKTTYVGIDVSFKSTSYDNDGEIVSWLWDFGDGSFADVSSVSHNFSSAGIFTVVLTVTDDHLLNSSLSKNITILEPTGYPPSITRYSPLNDPSIELGSSQTFSIEITDPDGDPLQIQWYLDDVESYSNVNLYEFEPDEVGTYAIRVSVSDGSFPAVEHSWTLTVSESSSPVLTREELWDAYKDDKTDSDKDGLPDWWEDAEGLDPNDPNDASDEMKEKFESEKDKYAPPGKEPGSNTAMVVLLIVIIAIVLIAIGLVVFLLMKNKSKPVPGDTTPQEPGDPQQGSETPDEQDPLPGPMGDQPGPASDVTPGPNEGTEQENTFQETPPVQEEPALEQDDVVDDGPETDLELEDQPDEEMDLDSIDNDELDDIEVDDDLFEL